MNAINTSANEMVGLEVEKVSLDTSISQVQLLALENSAEVSYKKERIKVARIEIKKQKVASLPTLSFRVEQDIWDSTTSMDETRALWKRDHEGIPSTCGPKSLRRTSVGAPLPAAF